MSRARTLADLLDSSGDVKSTNLDNVAITNLSSTASGIDVTGSVTADEVKLVDNKKLTFGNSDDLQIYHNGNKSIIEDSGTGELQIRASNSINLNNALNSKAYLNATDGGAVKVFFNGQQKLATTTSGIDVSGGVSIRSPSYYSGTYDWHLKQESGGDLTTSYYGSEKFRISDNGNVGIGTSSPTTGKLTITQGTDPGTTPAALNINTSGVGGGTATAQYGINIDCAQSYNNSTSLHGIKVVASQNVGNTTYGIESTVNPGNSTSLRYGIAGISNFSHSASFSTWNTTAKLPVGVYGEANNTAGDSNHLSTSAAGYFWNKSDAGATAYGAYINTTAGATSVVPLRVDHDGSAVLTVDSTGNVEMGGDLDVDGSVTADGLTVGDGLGEESLIIDKGVSNGGTLHFKKAGTTSAYIKHDIYEDFDIASGAGSMRLRTGTSNTERMRITSTGNVEIKGGIVSVRNSSGVTIPALKGSQFGYSSSYRTLEIGGTTGTNNIALGVDVSTNTSGSFGGYGQIICRNGQSFIQPNTTNTGFSAPMAFGTNGVVRLPLGIALGSGLPTAPTAANTLDDYEEGTWTPVPDVEGSGSITATGVSGRYTKIGRLVHIDFSFDVGAISGTATYNAIEVTGFPFGAASGEPYSIPVVRAGNLGSAVVGVTGYLNSSNQKMRIEEFTGSTPNNFSDHVVVGSNFKVSMSYITG